MAKEQDRILEWCKGDKHAAQFMYALGLISQSIDDVVDKDSEDPSKDLTAALSSFTMDVASNPFFQKNHVVLSTHILTALAMWHQANKLEKSKQMNAQHFSFVWRESLTQTMVLVATICGGYTHGLDVLSQMFEFYHTQESFEEWKKDLNVSLKLITQESEK